MQSLQIGHSARIESSFLEMNFNVHLIQSAMSFRRLQETHYVVGDPIPADLGRSRRNNEAN